MNVAMLDAPVIARRLALLAAAVAALLLRGAGATGAGFEAPPLPAAGHATETAVFALG